MAKTRQILFSEGNQPNLYGCLLIHHGLELSSLCNVDVLIAVWRVMNMCLFEVPDSVASSFTHSAKGASATSEFPIATAKFGTNY